MRINYPVKYAVMPVMEEPCYGNDNEWTTLCYIVTKCYVLTEYTEYDAEGFKTDKKEVLCPYKKDPYEYDTWRRTLPTKTLGLQYLDSFKTDALYDTFEEAVVAKDRKNVELMKSKKFYPTTRAQEYKQRILKNIDEYNVLEKLIEENTPDLVVNSGPRSQSFMEVGLKGNEVESRFQLTLPFYSVMGWGREGYNFAAYSLSEEEFNAYKSSDKYDYKEYIHTPLLIHKAKSKIIALVNGNDKRYLTYTDKGDIKEVSADSISPDEVLLKGMDLLLFTRENYTDIVNTYNLDNQYKRTLKLSKD